MQATISEARLPDEGENLYQLISIEEVMPSAESVAKYNKTEPRWQWKFRGKHVWEKDGKPQEANFWTNTKYGHPKAGLTRMYNMLIPSCNTEKAAAHDTDSDIGRWYKINVKHVPKDDGSGMKADYLYIQPYVKNGSAKPAAPVAAPEPDTAEVAAPDTKGDSPFD